MQSVTAHGAILPAIGLGTWKLTGETASAAVASAIEAGYRHIDTAIAYGNEAEVGEGLRRSGRRADEIFLTSKIPPEQLGDDDMMRAAEAEPPAPGRRSTRSAADSLAEPLAVGGRDHPLAQSRQAAWPDPAYWRVQLHHPPARRILGRDGRADCGQPV